MKSESGSPSSSYDTSPPLLTSLWCDRRRTPANGTEMIWPSCGLAPMVRIGHLGFRELCAKHGADVVFSEEVVAAKLARCTRELTTYPVDHRTPSSTEKVVEYVCYESWKNRWKRTIVFSALEKSRAATVLQLGVADPEIAAKAVSVVWQDVDGIDVNMGCPKSFSVKNGFGAALMGKPYLAGCILRAIHDTLNSSSALERRRQICSQGADVQPIPLSFKCRLRATPEETFRMLETILEAAGHTASMRVVHAITLHARYVDQRSETAAHYEEAASVVALCRACERFSGMVYVLNGSVSSRADATAKCKAYGFDAAMLARAALEDPTVFKYDDDDGKGTARRETTSAGGGPGAAATAAVAVTPARPPSTVNVAANIPPNAEAAPAATDQADLRAHYMKVLEEMWEYAVVYRTPFTSFKYHVQRLAPEVPVLKPLMPRLQEECREYTDYLRVIELPGGDADRERLAQLARRCQYDLVVLDSLEGVSSHSRRVAPIDSSSSSSSSHPTLLYKGTSGGTEQSLRQSRKRGWEEEEEEEEEGR